MKTILDMQRNNSYKELSIDPSIDRLLAVISLIAVIFVSPYFVWSNETIIYRIAHLLGNLILLYIFIHKHDLNLYNRTLVIFFLLISIYTMVGGTENSHITYVPIITLFFITLKPTEHVRVLEHFATIIAIVCAIGLVSYLLTMLGLNIQLGTATAPNIAKNPYLVYFGHIEETDLPIYRFSSIFDEAGLLGTLNGLILASIGISTKNIKTIILLIAGLISFSLAFYVILIFILLYNLNIKTGLAIVVLTIAITLASGDIFKELIASRLTIENGRLAGDNRTDPNFDEYYDVFVSKGGNSLLFGKGVGTFLKESEEEMCPSSYKLVIIDYGILGLVLMICFYALSTYFLNNSKKGWFLFFIFIISAYQRPDFIRLYSIVMFLGGLSYLKISSIKESLDYSNVHYKPETYIQTKNPIQKTTKIFASN